VVGALASRLLGIDHGIGVPTVFDIKVTEATEAAGVNAFGSGGPAVAC
jgi:hypothetical protein